MAVALLASGDFGTALDLLSQYGPFVGLLVLAAAFNMWRDFKRETKQNKRIDDLQTEVRETLIPLIRDNHTIIARSTLVMERIEKHLDN